MKLLNLGCGTHTSERVVNIDFSTLLKIRKSRALCLLARPFLGEDRLRKLRELPDNILVHDLRKGIPYPPCSVDAVYHSHLLEHLDREAAERFLRQVFDVLVPGGVHRVVVPDMEVLCREYVEHIALCASNPARQVEHDDRIGAIVEQMVRREAHGTSRQVPWKRRVENLLLGDARKRGETHQWAYDRINLDQLLKRVGFVSIQVVDFRTSSIDGWETLGLDRDASGREYKPGSLYVEARKP